jgi:solute carrier family 25 carnitine/acylcarnitine transporter 20/29
MSQDHFSSGFITGTLSSIFVSPLEMWKIRLQNHKLMCIHDMYKGFKYTLLRDSVGIGIYFYSYFLIKEKYDFDASMSGGIAGVLSWIYSYPFDVIKTQIQNHQKHVNYHNLYRGFSIMLIRSFLINSLAFTSFEKSFEFSSQNEWLSGNPLGST